MLLRRPVIKAEKKEKIKHVMTILLIKKKDATVKSVVGGYAVRGLSIE